MEERFKLFSWKTLKSIVGLTGGSDLVSLFIHYLFES